jgi:hypothetical protein
MLCVPSSLVCHTSACGCMPRGARNLSPPAHTRTSGQGGHLAKGGTHRNEMRPPHPVAPQLLSECRWGCAGAWESGAEWRRESPLPRSQAPPQPCSRCCCTPVIQPRRSSHAFGYECMFHSTGADALNIDSHERRGPPQDHPDSAFDVCLFCFYYIYFI